MTAPLSPTEPVRPWWKRRWGIVYLSMLGIATVATIALAALPVPSGEWGLGISVLKMIGLGCAVGALDVLLAIAIGIGVFRRRAMRLHRAPAADLVIGLILFALSTAAVVIFF